MLKFLFTVAYVDGTTFHQNREDVSLIDKTKSAYYDVLQSKKKIKKFTLSRFFERYSVDLITGEFDINGAKIHILGEPVPFIEGHLPELTLLREIQHKEKMNITFNINTKKILAVTPQSDDVLYIIGWETTIKGKHYKRIIGIK